MIAGTFRGVSGPAKTFSPVHLYDLRLTAGHQVDVALPEGFNSSLFVLRGQVVVNGAQHVSEVGSRSSGSEANG